MFSVASTPWPCVGGAHYLAGFGDRYTRQLCIRGLDWPSASTRRFAIERIPSGTNLFRLQVRSTDPVAFQKRLAAKGVMLSAPQRGAFLVGVNETLNRTTPAELVDAFVRASEGG
jgi:hypothetical protein